jgi:hypothetical protein
VQGLEQRAGVIVEDVVHFARGKARLDQVINLSAATRRYFDVEGHVGMQCRIGVGECRIITASFWLWDPAFLA